MCYRMQALALSEEALIDSCLQTNKETASMVAGGLFNAFAFAFAGAGYLFKMINSDGYGEEIKRHNLAMEQLTKARQTWNQKEIEEEKRIRKLQQERANAKADFSEINKSLKAYKKVLEIVHNGRKFTHEPHIWTFTHHQKK